MRCNGAGTEEEYFVDIVEQNATKPLAVQNPESCEVWTTNGT